MKIYPVIEVQNVGGVPPDKDRLTERVLRAIQAIDKITQPEPDAGGAQYSENEIVRVSLIEMEP